MRPENHTAAAPHQDATAAHVSVESQQQYAIDFDAAKARRDAGMASALDHAESDEPGWGDHCLALLRQFACLQAEPFTCEAFRAWAYTRGLATPPEERAFGPVTQKAIRGGFIARVGYAPAASSNGAIKATYVSSNRESTKWPW